MTPAAPVRADRKAHVARLNQQALATKHVRAEVRERIRRARDTHTSQRRAAAVLSNPPAVLDRVEIRHFLLWVRGVSDHNVHKLLRVADLHYDYGTRPFAKVTDRQRALLINALRDGATP
jgi:hypothetical protein